MTAHASYQSFDYCPVTVVPVIAAFDSEGHIKPLYVRIDGVSLKICSFWLKPSFGGIFEFNCQVADGGFQKPLTLSFHKTEGVWTIPAACLPKHKTDALHS